MIPCSRNPSGARSDLAVKPRNLQARDEHAAMWVNLRGKRGVPNSIRVLVDDADSIKEFLLKVADELENVKDNEEV